MKLIGQLDSPFVRRVAITMNYYNIPYERKVLSVFTNFDELLNINPLGKVPILELDDGQFLFDSHIILDYLDNMVPKEQSLMPVTNLSNSIIYRQIEAVGLGLAEKCYERGIEFSRKDNNKIDQNWTKRLEKQILSTLNWLESHNPNPWFCGQKISRPDITCAVALTFLFEKQQIDIKTGSYPFLEAHRKRCEQLIEFKTSPYSKSEALQSGWKARENSC